MTLKISTRLWLPTAAMAGLLVLMATTVGLRTSSQISATDALLSGQEAKLYDAATWQGLTTANAARVVAGVLSADPAVDAAMKPEIEATTARISEIQKTIESVATTDVEKATLQRVADARKTYIDARKAAQKLKTDGDAAGAKAALTAKVQPAVSAYLASQQAYVALQQANSNAVRAAAATERMRTVWAMVGVLLVIVVGLAIGTVFLVRSICHPMEKLADIGRRIGDGDLDVEVDTRRDDEIGHVMKSLAAMRDALRNIVGQVREAAESIQVASAEVASGNTDLSHRTEQTASSLQQTASSMEQLTGNVRQSADAASQANQLAASASTVARRGGDVVAEVVSTMDEINQSSKRIADIIGTIDGIAFQTNILALNAAVEAARAGEQGRGFAVVAGEVRSLAQRSAEAAREIKTLIGTSVDKVETGARLVQDAGSTMSEIVASVQRVTDIIGEITAAAGEQSAGIGQVNGAVNSLDQMTQQNAALVEQSAAAAESLKDQAHRLAEVVNRFQLGHGRSTPAMRQAAAPAAPASATPLRRPAVTHAPARTVARPTPTAAPAAATSVASASAHADADDWTSF